MDAAQELHQLQLRCIDPIQFEYEVIRPIVVDQQTVTARSQQLGLERTTLGDKARRFVQQGMFGLVDQRAQRAGRKAHVFPEPVARHMIYLKQIYPAMHYREIVRILERKFGYKTNHHTVKRFLDHYPIPVQLELKLTTFHEFESAYRARWTVVRLAYEGWQVQSIAGCLKLSRQHVYNILDAFEQDGFAGLEEHRTRPAHHPDNQLTLPLLNEVRELQLERPKSGRHRIHGILEKRHGDDAPSPATVGRAMATNRAFNGAPPAWSSDRKPDPTTEEVKELPFDPTYRHEFWFIDIRYLVERDGQWLYSICIIEGYSRKILAGMASDHQDQVAVLQLLYGALEEYGCPDAIVSDNGSVFTATAYLSILEALQITVHHIEKGRPWQNLIEAQFKIQLRLADAHFERTQTLDELQQEHRAFVELFNTTRHWAHRLREHGMVTPAKVLGWVRGRPIEVGRLQELFQRTEFTRQINQYGFVSIQRYCIYAEQGLAKQRVVIWIYEGQLRLAYQQVVLAQYGCDYDARQKQLKNVRTPRLFATEYRSPQGELFTLDEEQWRKVYQRPGGLKRRRGKWSMSQLPLPGIDAAAVLWVLWVAEVTGQQVGLLSQ